MDRVPLATKVNFASDVLAAGHAIELGVVAATTKTRKRYWRHWCRYTAALFVDPLLQNTDPIIRDTVLTGFAARVRTGHYGKGRQIKVQGVADALSAISKTIELAGLPSPVYRHHQVYTLAIQRCIEGMRRQDPPAVPQIAVPITVPNFLCTAGAASTNTKAKAIGDLTLIAFYYLLRVGEYTRPRTVIAANGQVVRATRTVQFTIASVGFFSTTNQEIPKTAPLAVLLAAQYVVLRITNQKNGRMGDLITHETILGEPVNCPGKALARRVHHVISNGGDKDTLLCSYLDELGTWHTLTPNDMRLALRHAARKLNLHTQGIDTDLIGVHSLRAGGAMAMKLNGSSDTSIKKQGRWSSLTFLQYIHNQIAHLTKDLSTKMSTPLPYVNVAHFAA